jgi:Polyketide cyclase / dehydrase and lipid transport
MASIIRETHIDASAADVWEAVRDFGAVDKRLVPGFVIESSLEGDATRVVTFFNGGVAREVLVGVDDAARRLAYSVVEGPLGATHHNASAQVFAKGEHGSRFVWITDVLPDQLGGSVGELMDQGIAVIKQTLESAAAIDDARAGAV